MFAYMHEVIPIAPHRARIYFGETLIAIVCHDIVSEQRRAVAEGATATTTATHPEVARAIAAESGEERRELRVISSDEPRTQISAARLL